MTDPLLTRPEFQEAVEAAMREYSIDPASATDGERGNWRNNLTAALPHIRQMLAAELRAADPNHRCVEWCADYLTRPEVMG